DNLYTTDLNRARVLVYYKPIPPSTSASAPTGTLTPVTPTTTFSPTPTPTAGCFQAGVTLPPPSGGFKNLSGLAVDYGNRYLYASDSTNNQIQVYSESTGNPVPLSRILGTGLFSGPAGLGVDSQGYLYVLDTGNDRVVKLSFDGTTAAVQVNIGQGLIPSPRGFYVDSNGDVYVTSFNGTVYSFPQISFNSYPTAPYTFGGSPLNTPTGLTKWGSTLYVAGTLDNQIMAYVETPGTPYTYSPGTPVNLGSAPLLDPADIKTDLAGNFYVMSQNNNQLLVFGPTFNWTQQLGLTGQGLDVAVDGNGNVFVGETGPNQVVEIHGCAVEPTLTPTNTFIFSPTPEPTGTPTPTQTFTQTFTSTFTPMSCPSISSLAVLDPFGVALDNGRNVYVADDSANQVDVFNSLGVQQAPIGAGTLLEPTGVAVDGNGNVLVTDDQDHVYVFNGGSLLRSWGGTGNTPGLFENPAGIAVNSAAASVYVADEENQRIQVFSETGTLLNNWGGLGFLGNGKFSSPTGVAVDASGFVYVTDWDTDLVQVFDYKGLWQRQWDVTKGTPLQSANFIAVYGCQVFVTDGFGAVGIFDLFGNFLGYSQGANTGFTDTEGVAVGNGNWYVADNGMNQVYQFGNCQLSSCSTLGPTPTWTPTQGTPANTFTPTITFTYTSTNNATIAPTFTNTPVPPTNTVTPNLTNCCQGIALAVDQATYGNPEGMVVDYGRNRLYIADAGNHLVRVYDLGGNTFLTSLTTPLSFPDDVAVDNDGNVFVSDATNGNVEKFSVGGNPLTSIGSGLSPRGVWVEGNSAASTVYVSSAAGNVYRFDGSNNSYPGSPSATYGGGTLNVPTGMVKVSNWLYVVDSGNSRVVKFDAPNPGTAAALVYSPLSNPAGIRTDLAGKFYVTEANASFIDRFDSGFTAIEMQCQVPLNAWGVAVNQNGNIFASEIGAPANTQSVTALQGCVQEPTLTPTGTLTTLTVTPTFTNTPAQPTNTSTPDPTITNTLTNTPVPPTNTFTFTNTFTNTFTKTNTPTFTNTPVPPTNTVTPNLTNCCQGIALAVDQATYGNPEGMVVDYGR
ncbi:MAG TPA: NHL repeat-containing protein, partial [bacterium]